MVCEAETQYHEKLMQDVPSPTCLLRHGAHQAECCPGAAEVGNGDWIFRGLLPWMSPGSHRPGPFLLLVGDQKRHAPLDLRPVGLHSRQTQEVERLAGGVGITCQLPF